MIEIIIPFKTPSINNLYGHFQNRTYLKHEGRKIRKEIIELIHESDSLHSFTDNDTLELTVEVNEDWYTKKGTIKKVDVANREKFLIDSVFEALGIDDRQIFSHTMIKVQNDTKEFSKITIATL